MSDSENRYQDYMADNKIYNDTAENDSKSDVGEHKRKIQVSGSKSQLMIRMVVLAAGIALVVIGVCRGDYLDVMNKAVRICYECIGIG